MTFCDREELEFIANTMLFLLSGIVIAGRIYESSHTNVKYIRASDWGYTLLLWVYLTVRGRIKLLNAYNSCTQAS